MTHGMRAHSDTPPHFATFLSVATAQLHRTASQRPVRGVLTSTKSLVRVPLLSPTPLG